MTNINVIRAANQAFAARRVANPVAVFVGATSGIGEAVMKKFTKYTVSPKIYFVGRNQTAGSRILAELKELNQTATVTFIQTSDISLLNNANAVAAEIKAKESHLNLLVMSQGQMTFQGRDETSEGLDRKLSTHYYSRALLTTAFLPLLQEASNDVLGSRVISVFSPGSEGPVLEDDFELKTGFSLSQAAKQAASFNSFMMETLSQKYPNVGFLHVYPSIVMTGLDRELPRWIKLVTTPFATLASVNIDDSGEGFVYLATDDKWKTGLALVDWKGADRDTRRVKKCEISGGGSWWDEKLGERVWTHTEQVFERIVGKVA